ncbi:MAG: molybdopterin molybdenumtransferase MoeA, partial [Rhodoferax sp.]|nr:molybdopterin molybdenumtransferase MoeA [Rhodoferax sp.]
MRPPRAPLKPLDDALNELLGFATILSEVEWVSTFDADGRVLAQDLVSGLQVPPQDNSSMDGYAVRRADVLQADGQALSVSQRIAAGSAGTELAPLSVARIFTGAPIPPGADAVVMQEDGEPIKTEAGDTVRFTGVPERGQWIRRAGEDVTFGAIVLSKGG